MKMEGDNEHFGDNGRLSWPGCWDGEDSSLSGLNMEHSAELSELVEDQEIAAQAVAFVVNSSRKGIVPLCADVAHIIRAKVTLEHKLARLRTENATLRSALSASSRTSPDPASLTSYEHRPQLDRLSPCLCSRCSSQCSSLVSNSPKLLGQRKSAFTVPANNAHNALPSSHTNGLQNQAAIQTSPETKVKGHRRKNSLPEIVSEPHSNVPKVSPRVKRIHAETQCNINGSFLASFSNNFSSSDSAVSDSSGSLEQQFRETLQINSRLQEDLIAAHKKIDLLQAELKEKRISDLGHQSSGDRFHVESETSLTCTRCCGRSIERTSSVPDACELLKENTGTGARLKTPSPVIIDGYLIGCKCSDCEKLAKKSESQKIKKSASGGTLNVELDDRVIIRGDKTGVIKYIGHLDNIGQPNMVFIGLQLDSPVGRHNGILNGKRYFFCEKDCGLVVPLSDVTRVLGRQHRRIHSLDDKHKPRISRSLSERVERECARKKRPGLKTEKHFTALEQQNLKLPKDNKLHSGHLV